MHGSPGGNRGDNKTQMWAANSKTQFYNTDGTGRDTYISLINGGFCPAHEPTKIEDLGKHLPFIYPYRTIKMATLFMAH